MTNELPPDNRIPQPRDRIRIEDLVIAPYPDRYRVRITIKVTPFQERPNLLLVARSDTSGQIVGELDIIATMHTTMEFTLHIRNVDDPAGQYTLTADLFFDTRNPPQDRCAAPFTIPGAEDVPE